MLVVEGIPLAIVYFDFSEINLNRSKQIVKMNNRRLSYERTQYT